MGYTLTKTDVRPLTREIVKEYAIMEHTPVEREIKKDRLRELRKRFETGGLLPFRWAKARCKDDGKTYRINGQHSSMVLEDMEGNLPDGGIVIEETWECDTLYDVVEIFRQIDDPISSRSHLDIAGAYASVVPWAKKLDRRVSDMLGQGIWWYMTKVLASDEAGDVPPRRCSGQLLRSSEVEGFVKAFGTLLSTRPKYLFRSHIVAAMYATWLDNSDYAISFWTAVKAGIEDSDAVPPQHLMVQLDNWADRCSDAPNRTWQYEYCIRVYNFPHDQQIEKPLHMKHKRNTIVRRGNFLVPHRSPRSLVAS